MTRNQDQDKVNSNPEKGRENAADDKATAEERKENRGRTERQGGKDDTVLGEINDE